MIETMQDETLIGNKWKESALRQKKIRTRNQLLNSIAVHSFLIITSMIVLLPIAYMFIASFKSVSDFFMNPYGLPSSWEWTNYIRAYDEANISVTFPNSVIVTFLSVSFSTLLAAAASFGISQMSKKVASPLYFIFVVGMMIPVQMIILPLFILLRQIGVFGTLWSVILPYTAFGLPLAVLILVPFFAALPSSLSDAARIDGAGEWRIFWSILLPLTRPALISVAILNGVWMWNEFFIPLIVTTKPEIYTLPLGIISFIGSYSTEWGLLFASVSIASIIVIVVYVKLTKYFVEGLSAGAVKG